MQPLNFHVKRKIIISLSATLYIVGVIAIIVVQPQPTAVASREPLEKTTEFQPPMYAFRIHFNNHFVNLKNFIDVLL